MNYFDRSKHHERFTQIFFKKMECHRHGHGILTELSTVATFIILCFLLQTSLMIGNALHGLKGARFHPLLISSFVKILCCQWETHFPFLCFLCQFISFSSEFLIK